MTAASSSLQILLWHPLTDGTQSRTCQDISDVPSSLSAFHREEFKPAWGDCGTVPRMRKKGESRIISDKSTNHPRYLLPWLDLEQAWGCFRLLLIRSVVQRGTWNRENARQLICWSFISVYEEESQHSCLVYHSTQVNPPDWISAVPPHTDLLQHLFPPPASVFCLAESRWDWLCGLIKKSNL